MNLRTSLAFITILLVHQLLLTVASIADHTWPNTSLTGLSLRLVSSNALHRHDDGFLNLRQSLHADLQPHRPSMVLNLSTLHPEMNNLQPLQTTQSLVLDFGTGNGRQSYTLKVDMSYKMTWIQCKDCNPYAPQHNPMFDPAASPTFQHVPGTSELCTPPYGSVRHGSLCAFELKHPRSTLIKGYLSKDQITKEALVYPNFVFGCSHYTQNFFNQGLYAGVASLARWPRSLAMQLAAQGLTQFSYCLLGGSKTNRQGFLRFGTDIPHNPRFRTTRILPALSAHESEYYLNLIGISLGTIRLDRIRPEMFARTLDGQGGCVIDLGTPLTVMVEEAYGIIEEAMWLDLQRHGAERMKRSGFGLCIRATVAMKQHLRSLSLHFADQEAVLVFSPKQLFLMIHEKQRQIACLAMMPGQRTIIGAFQQADTRFVYDVKDSKVSFAPESCIRDAA